MTAHPEIFVEPEIVDELRDICGNLAETAEARPFGAPCFQVHGKNYAMTNRDRDDRPGVWVKAPPGQQEALVGTFPDRYYRPPYVGSKGWIACWLDDTALPDWEEIEDLIVQSYRLVAPKRLVKAMDASIP